MAKLPQFQNNDKDLQLLQNKWSQILNPLISNPSNNVAILKEVSLETGSNMINHLLGRPLLGWRIIRQRAAASIYDDQDNNEHPNKFLVLVSSAPVIVDLEVFA